MSRTLFSSALLLLTLFGVNHWIQKTSDADSLDQPFYNQPAGPHLEPEWYERQQRMADAKEQQHQQQASIARNSDANATPEPTTIDRAIEPARAAIESLADKTSDARPESKAMPQHQPLVAPIQPARTRNSDPVASGGDKKIFPAADSPVAIASDRVSATSEQIETLPPDFELGLSPRKITQFRSTPDDLNATPPGPTLPRRELATPRGAKEISESMRRSLRQILDMERRAKNAAAVNNEPDEFPGISVPKEIAAKSLTDTSSGGDSLNKPANEANKKPLDRPAENELEENTTSNTNEQPPATKPPATKPAATKPAATKPAATKPAKPQATVTRTPEEPHTAADTSDALNEQALADSNEGPMDSVAVAPKKKQPVITRVAPPVAVLSPEMEQMKSRVRATLAFYYNDLENYRTRSPWGVMHSMLPFGVDSQLAVDGRRVNTLGWLCWNGQCRDQQLLYTEQGELRTRQGPGVQGHRGQFLSMLAQSKVKRDFALRVDGADFTVGDLVRYEMDTCRPKSELTFKLIGLSHYLKSDTTWTTSDGEQWSIERLIEEELAQQVNGAACGGTHRLMGFAYAVNRRLKRDEPLTGQWRRAADLVRKYHKHAATLRNSDGSYSTSWFEKPEAYRDIDRRMQTTGHILEWLVFSLPREELEKRYIVESVDYLNHLMFSNRGHEWPVGPKGHAIRALALYDERVFGGRPGERNVQLAEIARRLR